MSKVQELLKVSYEKYGDNDFITYKNESNVITKKYRDVILDILSLSEMLLSKNLSNKNILLIGKNSYEWLVSWTAILGYVGVVIPVDNSFKLYSLEKILNNIPISCIIYSSDIEEVTSLKEKYKDIVYFNLDNDIKKLINDGRKILDKKQDKFLFDDIDDSKACELNVDFSNNIKFITFTQENLLANFKYFNMRLPLSKEDSILFSLPMFNHYISIYAYLYSYYTSTKLYIAEENYLDFLNENITTFFGVPKNYKEIIEKYGEKNIEKINKKISKSKLLYKYGIKVDKVKFFKKFHNFLGGNIKYLILLGENFDKK